MNPKWSQIHWKGRIWRVLEALEGVLGPSWPQETAENEKVSQRLVLETLLPPPKWSLCRAKIDFWPVENQVGFFIAFRIDFCVENGPKVDPKIMVFLNNVIQNHTFWSYGHVVRKRSIFGGFWDHFGIILGPVLEDGRHATPKERECDTKLDQEKKKLVLH